MVIFCCKRAKDGVRLDGVEIAVQESNGSESLHLVDDPAANHLCRRETKKGNPNTQGNQHPAVCSQDGYPGWGFGMSMGRDSA
jgi:hypothetical protein